MGYIVTAHHGLLMNKHALYEVKSYPSPSKNVKCAMKLVQAFIKDKKYKEMTWLACKNEIFKDLKLIQGMDFDFLSTNQLHILDTADFKYQDANVDGWSVAVSVLLQFLAAVKKYADTKY